MIQNTNNNINQSLRFERISIGQFKELNTKKKKVNNIAEQEQRIRKKKQMILKKLQAIEEQEQEIKMIEKIQNTLPVKFVRSKERSVLTEQDIDKLKKLWIQNKRLEKQLKIKDQKLKKELQEQRLQSLKKNQQQNEEKRRLRRENIQQRLKENEKRQIQRARINQQTQKQLRYHLNKKYLFNEFEEKFQRREEDIQKQKQERYLTFKKYKQIDLNQVKQHDKRYRQLIQKQKSERLKKLIEFKQKMAKNDDSIKYPSTYFTQIVKEQQQNRKKNFDKQKRQASTYHQKIVKYNQAVRSNVLEKMIVPQKKLRKPEQPQVISTLKSLSLIELNKKGNEYMQIAKNRTKKKQKNQQLVFLPGVPQKKLESKPNYLRQLRLRNGIGNDRSDINKIRKIIKQHNMSADKIQQATNLVHKMESLAGNDYDKIVSSIKAKIEILQHIQ